MFRHHKKVPHALLSQRLRPQKPPPQINAPLFAAVESDIVGYTQIEMQAGKWYQIGNPFVGLDGSLEQALNQVFTSGFALGDTLLVFNPETGIYEQQLYWVPDNEGSGTWCSLPIPGAPASDKTLVAGQAVYINKAGGSGTVTLAGSVKPVEVEFGSEAGNAWAQVVAVWPEEKALNEMKWSGLALGDTLLVFNPETKLYEQQLYWVPGGNGSDGAWCALPIPGTTPSTKVLKAGQAVFINKASRGIGKLLAQ